MKINVPRFRNLAKKVTLNYTIDCMQLNVGPNLITSSMISGQKDVITNISVENDCILNMGAEDRITLNFSDPAGKLNRFLEVVPDETEILSIEEGAKIVLNAPGIQGEKSVAVINMVDDSVIRPYLQQRSANVKSYFLTLPVDDLFYKLFETHKKIAPYYQKIYFGVKNKKFYILSGDVTNTRENNLDNDICDIEHDDLTMCFEFRNFLNMISTISDSTRKFTLSFTFSANEDRGLIHAVSDDLKEKYFLISRSL